MTFLTKNAPPGADIYSQVNWYFGGLIFIGVWSLGFLFRFSTAYHNLYYTSGSIRYLRSQAIMPEFTDLLGGSLRAVFVIVLVLLVCIVMNYASFRQGSKSIYLMKRLPSRWELHRRCILLPALGIVGSLVMGFTLLMIYFAIYMLVTPDRCLPPDQWQKLWSVLL